METACKRVGDRYEEPAEGSDDAKYPTLKGYTRWKHAAQLAAAGAAGGCARGHGCAHT